jgi:nitrogen fixation protein NifB
MALSTKSILNIHPCYSTSGHTKYGRMHLPVAPKCNIGCNYCDRRVGVSYHSYRPALAEKIISPQEALQLVSKYISQDWLKVAGIAGPGEPLYNEETFETLELINDRYPNLILCVATNGLLLPRYAEELAALGVRTITVTINSIDSKIGSKIYSYVNFDDQKLLGEEGVGFLLEKQLQGITEAVKLGIIVKINTVLIPGINDNELTKIAKETSKRGASIQNITPLIPLAKFKSLEPPSCEQLSKARAECEKIIPQFRQCQQCRADSIGIPGLSELSPSKIFEPTGTRTSKLFLNHE